MKKIIATALTTALITSTFLLYFSPMHREGSIDVRIKHLADISAKNTEKTNQLLAELSRLRGQIESQKIDHSLLAEGEEVTTSEELADRIETLEIAFNKLESTASMEPDRSEKSLNEILSHSRQQYFQSGQNPHYIIAEDEFQNDAGLSLNGYSETIEDTLHAIPGIEVREMDCKNSICKVTYWENRSAESNESTGAELEVVDMLAQSIDGYAVELTYATDPSGNRIMYMQLK